MTKAADAILAYEDIRTTADAAVASPRGIAFLLPSHGQAVRWRQRFYKFRLLSRKISTEMYEAADPRYGKSPYEELVVKNWEQLPGIDQVKVEIVKVGAFTPEVTEL